MVPRPRTRQEIIDLLGRAAWEAERAEVYHEAAADPGALKGRAAQQAACDAAAMQLIELAGCAEDFTRNRGDPGTTLARFDDALRPVFEVRTPHTHPEIRLTLPPLTPRRLSVMIEQLKTSIANLDSDTLRIQPRDQLQALTGIAAALARIEKDGLADAAALRPRDLHYAGYYREIQFGRLAKATGLYDNMDKSEDARLVDVNRSIFDADDMAHKFHVMRGGVDKSVLPESVVAPGHRDRVPGRLLSELMRELRDEYRTPGERLAELEMTARARAREEHRTAVRRLAQFYARITGDSEAAGPIRDFVQRKEPPLDREMIDAIREALEVAVAPRGDYRALPEAVRNLCLELCLALDEKGDSRLLGILDIAEVRNVNDRSVTREVEDPEIGVDLDFDKELGPGRRR